MRQLSSDRDSIQWYMPVASYLSPLSTVTSVRMGDTSGRASPRRTVTAVGDCCSSSGRVTMSDRPVDGVVAAAVLLKSASALHLHRFTVLPSTSS